MEEARERENWRKNSPSLDSPAPPVSPPQTPPSTQAQDTHDTLIIKMMAFPSPLLCRSPPSSPLLGPSSDMDVEQPCFSSFPQAVWLQLQLNSAPSTLNCLAKHGINVHMRARMVDWIVDVMLKMDSCPNSIFVAVKVMDGFFKGCELRQNQGDLLSIGMVSMFLASKYLDRYPIRMATLYQKVGFERVSKDALRLREAMILSTLDFSMSHSTPLDALDLLMSELGLTGVMAKTCELIILLIQLEPDLAALAAAKQATSAVFITCMTYAPSALPYILHLSGYCRGEIERECDLIYNFIMDFSSRGQMYQSIFENLHCSSGTDDAHPLFRFENAALEQEAARLLEEARR